MVVPSSWRVFSAKKTLSRAGSFHSFASISSIRASKSPRYGSALPVSLVWQGIFGRSDGAAATLAALPLLTSLIAGAPGADRAAACSGWLFGADAPSAVLTAACCSVFKSAQCRSTHRTAIVPEGMSSLGPGDSIPGIGPIACTNALNAVAVSTEPSGLTFANVLPHGDADTSGTLEDVWLSESGLSSPELEHDTSAALSTIASTMPTPRRTPRLT